MGGDSKVGVVAVAVAVGVMDDDSSGVVVMTFEGCCNNVSVDVEVGSALGSDGGEG